MSQDIGNTKWRVRLWLYAPLLVWIGVIFFLSSNLGSMKHTSLIIRPVLEFLFPAADEPTLQLYHSYVRKAAHFTEYALLALLACRLFFGINVRRAFAAAFAVCLAVATLDEFNQSFNPERTSSGYDVLLDCAGAAFAILCVWLLSLHYSRRALRG